MKRRSFPDLDIDAISVTRDALHAYARVLGTWTSTSRARRKHWWHASLRPSLHGVTTGVIDVANLYFEIEMNFRESNVLVRTASGEVLKIELRGQSSLELAVTIQEYLLAAGVSEQRVKAAAEKQEQAESEFVGYSAEQANKLGRALGAINAALVSFRADLREETSPIQLWPHHFDLAMLWLPGDKIEGQNPEDEEYSDKQMNFGFTFGDAGIPEPYFYITAYPSPDEFATLSLPAGTQWRSDGFTGAVLTYERLLEEADPSAYLLQLWRTLQAFGKQRMTM